jgi:hypothetical protein
MQLSEPAQLTGAAAGALARSDERLDHLLAKLSQRRVPPRATINQFDVDAVWLFRAVEGVERLRGAFYGVDDLVLRGGIEQWLIIAAKPELRLIGCQCRPCFALL